MVVSSFQKCLQLCSLWLCSLNNFAFLSDLTRNYSIYHHTHTHTHTLSLSLFIFLFCIIILDSLLLYYSHFSILNYYFIFVGHKNSNKVLMPHVVSMAKEPNIMSKKPHAWTVRPRQWHVAKGGPAVKKRLQKGGQP